MAVVGADGEVALMATTPVRKPTPLWVTVRCPECGKKLCEAMPGSTVKKLCGRCKQERVVAVAA